MKTQDTQSLELLGEDRTSLIAKRLFWLLHNDSDQPDKKKAHRVSQRLRKGKMINESNTQLMAKGQEKLDEYTKSTGKNGNGAVKHHFGDRGTVASL